MSNKYEESNNKYNYDLYLSYNVSQKRNVQEICKLFKNSKLKVWLAKEEDQFDDNLNALQSSLIFVCFPCKEYQKCIKNRIEYSIAKEQGMKIINFYFHDQYTHSKNGTTDSMNIHIERDLSNYSIELQLIVKNLKKEADLISKTYKQSYKNTVNTWFKTI